MISKGKVSAKNIKRPIPLFKVFMNRDAVKSVSKVLLSGYIGQGQKINEFENKLKQWLQTKYVLTMNSATSAEHLALHLLKKPSGTWEGLEECNEVLATPLTCTATNWPILANNLKIKWVDANENNLNIDLEDLERKMTPKTKVIMVVHWGGYPVDLDRLNEIKEKAYNKYGFKPKIIEDCAHAFGATYKGKKIGNQGNICTFSFQAIKHINSVDGGLLVVPSKELYSRGKLLRWYGIDREQNTKDFRCEKDIKEWGFKFHMNDVNAAVGIENLKYADKILNKHRENAQYYNKHLKNLDGVTLHENKKDRQSSYWLYSILVERKQDFMNWMKECGIIVSQVHQRNDIHTCVKEFRCHLPQLDRIVPRLVSIPVGWWIAKEDREYIVECIKKGW